MTRGLRLLDAATGLKHRPLPAIIQTVTSLGIAAGLGYQLETIQYKRCQAQFPDKTIKRELSPNPLFGSRMIFSPAESEKDSSPVIATSPTL